VALRFSPDGTVHACCVNMQYRLGRIGEEGIADIWRGTRLGALREALDAADYSLGCQDCGVLHVTGDRGQTHAEQFDRFEQPAVGAEWPRRLEFALSNRCNLQCVQCNGDYSSAIRAQREQRPPLVSPYDDDFFAELAAFLPHVEVAVFIGGEPFLARECRRVWDLLIEEGLRPEVHVTTNGTVWDDRVEYYVRTLNMHVAVSVDGATAATNDAIRVGADLDVVRANRDRFRAVTREQGTALGINHCLMVENWTELGEVLLEGDRLDADVHVIPVVYPPVHSLLCLPAEELAAVVDQLEAEHVTIAPRLGRNRGAWDATLAHLRLRLEPPPSVPVALAPYTFLDRDEAVLAAADVELRAWGDGGLLDYEVADGIVGRVGPVPDWAAPLGAEQWPTQPAPALLDELRRRLGVLLDVTRDADPGVDRAHFAIDHGDQRAEYRLVGVEWHEGLARHSRLLLARRPVSPP